MATEPSEPEDTTKLSAGGLASPTDSLQQFPMDLVNPDLSNSDAMLSRFRSIVKDEISIPSRKLSSDLMRGLNELGHRTNQLEQWMDLITTVLEGHEDEVDKLNSELESLRDKLKD